MSKTIIDELVVTLGLDPKNFKKGEKEAVDSLRDLEKNAKKTGDEVQKSADKGGNAIMALGKRVAVVATIFKVLSYTTKNILEASRATYDLANAGRMLGESARGLRNFQNVAEMMGGTAEGATKTIQGLKQAVHDLAYNGTMSQQLVQLGRLGVGFQNRDGRARDFKDIYLDTAGALQKQVASGQMSESDALMFAESAGFDPGLARSMVGGRDAASLALARQEARRQVSGEDVAAATANEQAMISANQARDATFTGAQTKASDWITSLAGGKEKLFNAGETGSLATVWEAMTTAAAPASAGLVSVAEGARDAGNALVGLAHKLSARASGGREAYRGVINDAARRHGLDPSILGGVLGAESNYNPDAVSPAGAVGVAQLMPQYFPGAGMDPHADIETAAGELARLKRSFMKTNGGNADGAMELALMAYNAGETRLRNSSFMKDGGKALDGETTAYPGRVYEWAERYGAGNGGMGAGGDTQIQIDEINVNTAATDANGIASSIGDATRRKLTTAQPPQSMQ